MGGHHQIEKRQQPAFGWRFLRGLIGVGGAVMLSGWLTATPVFATVEAPAASESSQEKTTKDVEANTKGDDVTTQAEADLQKPAATTTGDADAALDQQLEQMVTDWQAHPEQNVSTTVTVPTPDDGEAAQKEVTEPTDEELAPEPEPVPEAEAAEQPLTQQAAATEDVPVPEAQPGTTVPDPETQTVTLPEVPTEPVEAESAPDPNQVTVTVTAEQMATIVGQSGSKAEAVSALKQALLPQLNNASQIESIHREPVILVSHAAQASNHQAPTTPPRKQPVRVVTATQEEDVQRTFAIIRPKKQPAPYHVRHHLVRLPQLGNHQALRLTLVGVVLSAMSTIGLVFQLQPTRSIQPRARRSRRHG